MFRDLEPLALVIRDRARAIKELWSFGHYFIDEAADHLPVLQKKRNLVTADFENRAGGRTIVCPGAEAWIEKARVMYPEFAHRGVDRNHFGGKIGWNLEPLPGGENIELIRVEDQPLVAPRPDLHPIVCKVIVREVYIENIGVFLRFVADHPIGRFGAQANPQHEPAPPQFQIAIDKRDFFITFTEFFFLEAEIAALQLLRVQPAEADLVEF